MFGFYGERSPYPFGSSNKPNKRTMKAVREMLEDMEFARKVAELMKTENDKKDKDKKDGEKKTDKIKDFFAVMFLLTFFGPFVGLLQLHVLKWVANSWQTVLP